MVKYFKVNNRRDVKMADKTYGFKVSEEFYDRAKLVIETSGISNKDWFEHAVALYEMNSIKEGASDYKQDLTELEHHTTRMYQLIVNMIQRSKYLKDHAVQEVADKLESKESVITNLQQQVQRYKEELLSNAKTIEELSEKTIELEEKLFNNQTMFSNNQALIDEYKLKNDTLNGLVVNYKKYADENEQLKRSYELEKEKFINKIELTKSEYEEQIKELTEQMSILSLDVQNAQKELEQVKSDYERDATLLLERKEVEKEKAIVELKSFHNEEVRKLYDENANLRKMYQEMKEQLQNEIAKLREKAK